MKTAHKIAAARTLYWIVRSGRALMGKTDRQIVRRNGLAYDLDLSQGIDFAIYLGVYERATSAALRRLVPRDALVVDVGDNIGSHSGGCSLAIRTSQRFMFETLLFGIR